MRAPFLLLLQLVLLLKACNLSTSPSKNITIGVVSFDRDELSLKQYSSLEKILEVKVNSSVELEKAYNKSSAMGKMNNKDWDLVIAPPGLAAFAISQGNYEPIFPLEGAHRSLSVMVVKAESPINQLSELKGKKIALGQVGSATGYFLPIYNLYGSTLAEVRLTPTPKTILEWIAEDEVVAGAMSLEEFERHRLGFLDTKFRILHTDTHNIPSGSILISKNITPNKQEKIYKALLNISPAIANSTGYIPNAPVPNYQYLLEVVKRVDLIAKDIEEKPARLY